MSSDEGVPGVGDTSRSPVEVDPRTTPYPLPWRVTSAEYPPGSVAVGLDARGAPVPLDWPHDPRPGTSPDLSRWMVPPCVVQVLLPRIACLFHGVWLVATPVPTQGHRWWGGGRPVPAAGSVEAYDLWPVFDSSAASSPMGEDTRVALGFGPLPPVVDSVRASVRRRWGNPEALRVPGGDVDGVRARLLGGERWQADDPLLAMSPGEGLRDLGLRWAEIAHLAGQGPGRGEGPGATSVWDPTRGRPRESWPTRGNTPGFRLPTYEPLAGARPRQSVLLTLDDEGRVLPRSGAWERSVTRADARTAFVAGTPTGDTASVVVRDPTVPGRRVIAAAHPVLVVEREGWPLLAEATRTTVSAGTGTGTWYRTYPVTDHVAHPGPVTEDVVRHLRIGEWGRDGETYGFIARDAVVRVYVRLLSVAPWTSSTTVDLVPGEDMSDLMGRPDVVRHTLRELTRRPPDAP